MKLTSKSQWRPIPLLQALLVVIFVAIMQAQVRGSEGDMVGAGAVSKSTGPPSFFLRDMSDGLCMAGDKFKRCAIDTLWFVTGKSGQYQIHRRPSDEADDDDLCFGKAQCHLDESASQLGSCDHCGAKKWNILGDADSGYVLTQDGNKNCVKRKGDKAILIKCDKGYSGLQLQFTTKDELEIMNSDGSRLATAAADNDERAVKNYLNKKVEVDSRDWDSQTPLMAAAGKGHINTVKLLIKYKANVNLQDKDNVTALMEGSIGGFKSVVEFLLNNGADVNATATSGFSSLWLAAGEGHTEVVKLLLKKKADPDNARTDGSTALMAAVAGAHLPVVQELIKSGVDVNKRDMENVTALISAAENGSLPIVKALIDGKAEVNVVSVQGFSPLIVASAHGHVEVAKALVKAGAEIELQHPDNVTALMYAAAGGFPEVVKYLISAGANVNLRHKQGGGALLEASTSGNVSCVELLLAAGADPLIVDNEGVTTLMAASSQGHTDVVKILLSKNVDVNKVANSGGTALMFAAGSGHNDSTRLLLDAKADTSIRVKATPEYIEQVAKAIAERKEGVEPHKDGIIALHVAAQGGHLGTVKLLVEAGSPVDVKDEEGMTPLLNAVKGNYASVAFYLVEHGANPNDVYIDDKGKRHNLLMDSILVTNTNFSLLLIEKGANTSFADDDGVTVTCQAAYMGQLPVVQALLAKGVDITQVNEEGINPLIAAASEGHVEVVNALLAVGTADINAKDKDGTNALMAASVRGHKSVVELLLKHKPNVNAQNVDGHTALMFAYNGKNQVETLLDKYAEYLKKGSDNSTKIIKDALETHVNVIQLLLENGADASLKDNEGHVAADFDYKPAVVESVAVEGGAAGAASADSQKHTHTEL